MAMAAAGACVRSRPLNRVLSRAFRAAAAAQGNRAPNDVARRQPSLLGSHETAFTFGSNSSSASFSSSHGSQWLALGAKAPGFSRTFASGGEPVHQKITMPALSPTMTQGNVVTWKKNEGDKVSAGDVLCEIETDKATLDLEAMEDGFLAKIVAPGGTKDIPVGEIVCIVVEEEGDVGKFANYSAESSTSASSKEPSANSETNKPPSTPKETGPPPAASSPAPDVPFQNISMPALSPTMTQGNVLKWKKNEGDKLTAGDVLCEIETDKATLDMEAMEDGYLAKILVQAGSKDIQVGETLCVVVEEEGDLGKFKDYTGDAPAKSEGKQADKSSETSVPAPTPAAPATGPKKNRVGPSVRRYLAESGLDASSIAGTGPNGMLVKGDILSAIKSGPPKQKEISAGPEPPAKSETKSSSSPPSTTTPAAPLSEAGSYTDKPNIQIRKIIAKRLLESKTQIPHFYLNIDATVDATLGLRKAWKEKNGTSVSVNDFVIKATALALRDVPEANASWDEKSGEVKLNNSIDISVAVATDRGLMTPIVKDADKKSLAEISAEVKSLAEKARNGKLKPQEFQGGTFSISNLGMFAVDRFSAIINPPQACILAVGRGNKAVEWSEDGSHPVVVTKMGLTLSADNRVYNGEIGGRFLDALSKNLSDPTHMLL